MPVLNGMKKFEAKQRGEEYNDDDCNHETFPLGSRFPEGSATGLAREWEQYYLELLERVERQQLFGRVSGRDANPSRTMGLDRYFTERPSRRARNEPERSNPPSEQQDGFREDRLNSARWRAARANLRAMVRAMGDTVRGYGCAFIADSTVGTESQVALARKAYVQSISSHYRTRIEEVREGTRGWLVYAPEDSEERGVQSVRDVWQGGARRPQDSR